MAKKENEQEIFDTDETGMVIDTKAPEVISTSKTAEPAPKIGRIIEQVTDQKPLISCLRNETVIIRFAPKKRGLIRDPKHVLYGGMSDKASVKFVVPRLESGRFVNVLTNDEKAFLENILGLEQNALSIYKSTDNYWSTRKVVLTKQDTFLHLSDPIDYISYKILLQYPDVVAKNHEELTKKRKATYKFYMTTENEEVQGSVEILDNKRKAYNLVDKLSEDINKLLFVIKELSGKSLSPKVDKKILAFNVDKVITNSADKFVKLLEDPYFDTKYLMSRALQVGVVVNRNRYYYLRENNAPMNLPGKEPTLQGACEYLNSPMYSEERFKIEAIVNKQ